MIATGAATIIPPIENIETAYTLRSVEDVPFLNVYEQEDDEVPFDISDIIADRKARRDK